MSASRPSRDHRRRSYRPPVRRSDQLLPGRRSASRPRTGRICGAPRVAHGFMVAGAGSDALLEDFQPEIQRAWMSTTLAEFRKAFDTIVEKHGWEFNGMPGWRSSIIYDTNLSTAYSAGRYAQLTDPEVRRAFPIGCMSTATASGPGRSTWRGTGWCCGPTTRSRRRTIRRMAGGVPAASRRWERPGWRGWASRGRTPPPGKNAALAQIRDWRRAPGSGGDRPWVRLQPRPGVAARRPDFLPSRALTIGRTAQRRRCRSRRVAGISRRRYEHPAWRPTDGEADAAGHDRLSAGMLRLWPRARGGFQGRRRRRRVLQGAARQPGDQSETAAPPAN